MVWFTKIFMRLFGVKLPQTTKQELLQKIQNLDTKSKQSLYFFYSEFLLRANRNPHYKAVLQNSSLSAIDGRGLNWCLWRLLNSGKIPKFWSKIVYKLPFLIAIPIFLIFFVLELIINLCLLSFSLLQKQDLSKKTENELILGRDFIYDLLEIAETKNWKTLVLGGSLQTKDLILKKFPRLSLNIWFKSSDSDLMRDKPFGEFIEFEHKLKSFFEVIRGMTLEIINKVFSKKIIQSKNLNKNQQKPPNLDQKTNNLKNEESNKLYGAKYPDSHTWLTQENLFEIFPDLEEVKSLVKEQKPDLILVCLGGSSGKQEFLIDALSRDKNLEFGLAAGFGAAIDHLGAGALQKVAPNWMQGMGLEWLYRLINQPYRRFRILDSIFSLWWWLTVQEFMKYFEQKPRQTAVVIVENLDGEILLVKRKNWIPGDVGWSFVQGGIEKSGEIIPAAIRELVEETGINKLKIISTKQAFEGNLEFHTVSFLRLFLNKASQSSSQHQIVKLEYSGKEVLKSNWENMEIRWVKKQDVEKFLSIEKRIDWEIYRKQNENFKT